MERVIDRFIRYTKIHTTSDPKSTSFPSTDRQLIFADMLVEELNEIGMTEVEKDQNGYVTATLAANTDETCPTIGFVAHMDTSPDFSGKNVNPQILNYKGGVIQLNDEISIDPKQFPDVENYIGEDIITTDGNTLLGADDKAGLAEIMTAMQYLILHPEIRHGKIRVCFTPDEEIGKGADHFDVEKFGAKFAYTLDGGEIGELEYENFNAAMAVISIKGRSVHPGAAKNKMLNAIVVGQQLLDMLPPEQRPEHTEKYEGFFHCVSFEGAVDETKLAFIIRDHDREKFENRKMLITQACEFLNARHGAGAVYLELSDQYYNMQEKVEPVKYIVDLAEKAMNEIGVTPKIKAIRGGTDGARLSYMGLPCPNIFAGGHNFHGPYEYVPTKSLVKAVEVIIRIAEKVVTLRNDS